MNNEPLEREPIDRVRARLEALLKANAAPRCGARSKRTGKPCQGAAMPNGRCKLHGGKSTGPRTPEGLARSRREAKAERSRVRAAILADHTGPSIHRHRCQWQGREGFRAQAVQAELTAR